MRERIPGGLSSGKEPSDFPRKALKAGMKVESEHTTDPRIAREISMDHLTEDPAYYKKLRKMEKAGEAPSDSLTKHAPSTSAMTKKRCEYCELDNPGTRSSCVSCGSPLTSTNHLGKMASAYDAALKEAAISPAAAAELGIFQKGLQTMKGLVGAPIHGMTPRAGQMLKTEAPQVVGLGNRGRQVGPVLKRPASPTYTTPLPGA